MPLTHPLNSVLLHNSSRCGIDLAAWLSTYGGKGLSIALQDPACLISLIKQADLRGLGGSGFPTHKKWSLVANQPSEDRYLICNGNEDEPGTFKDRILLEETPHQVIEGALITALASHVRHIIFYINPSQRKALTNMQYAIAQWKETPYVAEIEKRLKKSLNLNIIISPGHYVAGEETAAIESIEGKFPFPRGKPPYPTQQGVHHQPTLINNIETLANVSHIVRKGAQWYQNLGLKQASGTKLYCLSGDVNSPGVYELPMGVSLETLIFHYGGGIRDNKKLKAIFTGGPSNRMLTANDIDVALDFDSVAQRRASLGTGAMIVVAEGECIVEHVSRYIDFFARASCGQCPPCKTGTYQLSLRLKKIGSGQGNQEDLDTLIQLSKMLPDSGRCHLPNGVAKVLESSLHHFMDEYVGRLN